MIVSIGAGLLLCLAAAMILLLDARRVIDKKAASAFHTARTTATSWLPYPNMSDSLLISTGPIDEKVEMWGDFRILMPPFGLVRIYFGGRDSDNQCIDLAPDLRMIEFAAPAEGSTTLLLTFR